MTLAAAAAMVGCAADAPGKAPAATALVASGAVSPRASESTAPTVTHDGLTRYRAVHVLDFPCAKGSVGIRMRWAESPHAPYVSFIVGAGANVLSFGRVEIADGFAAAMA